MIRFIQVEEVVESDNLGIVLALYERKLFSPKNHDSTSFYTRKLSCYWPQTVNKYSKKLLKSIKYYNIH